ncbi:MAG: hypothetical protein WB773_06645, partial [Isosphaeraceae bacterium]
MERLPAGSELSARAAAASDSFATRRRKAFYYHGNLRKNASCRAIRDPSPTVVRCHAGPTAAN